MNQELKISSRLALLSAGLYVIRHATAPPDNHSSCVTLNPSPIGKGSVDFFPGEGVSRNTLVKAGDCIITRVKGEQAGVLITEFKTSINAPSVELRIDRVATDPRVTPSAPAPAAVTPLQAGKLQAVLTGHIERTGDVTVDRGWLGSPDSRFRIEGFAVTVPDAPEGLVVAYSCRTGPNSEPDLGTAGQFVGTRRQARPITSVAFVLSGERATDFELTGLVAFAACPPLAIVPGKELSGPTGTEQLVALQLAITPKATPAFPPASPWGDSSRTQIFRE